MRFHEIMIEVGLAHGKCSMNVSFYHLPKETRGKVLDSPKQADTWYPLVTKLSAFLGKMGEISTMSSLS